MSPGQILILNELLDRERETPGENHAINTDDVDLFSEWEELERLGYLRKISVKIEGVPEWDLQTLCFLLTDKGKAWQC